MSAAASPALDALTQKHLSDLITRALEEDVGSGDITTESTVPEDSVSRATFLAKDDGVLSGLTVADQVFATVDPELKVRQGAHTLMQLSNEARIGNGTDRCLRA